jgi:hypothetical protein
MCLQLSTWDLDSRALLFPKHIITALRRSWTLFCNLSYCCKVTQWQTFPSGFIKDLKVTLALSGVRWGLVLFNTTVCACDVQCLLSCYYLAGHMQAVHCFIFFKLLLWDYTFWICLIRLFFLRGKTSNTKRERFMALNRHFFTQLIDVKLLHSGKPHVIIYVLLLFHSLSPKLLI